MPQCPKCKEPINTLTNECGVIETLVMYIDDTGEPQYEHQDSRDCDGGEKYYCPECKELLFTMSSEAVGFLKSV